jgi:ABC-type multidrug transport system fused ATPase/permease subunit
VIVLDEATSSLDPARRRLSGARWRPSPKGGRWSRSRTGSPRLSADRVAVMERGRLVEVATHRELVEQGARYACLWESWQAGLAAGAA